MVCCLPSEKSYYKLNLTYIRAQSDIDATIDHGKEKKHDQCKYLIRSGDEQVTRAGIWDKKVAMWETGNLTP